MPRTIDIDNLVQWQLYSEKDDAIYPWFVHDFLKWLDTVDFSKSRVLEYGAGRSSRWWRKRAKWVTSIDTNEDWLTTAVNDCRGLDNGMFVLKEINEGDQSRAEEYVSAGDAWGPYDIVVVDGILRHECVLKALSMPRPLLLIVDNFEQDGFVCPATVEALKPWECHNYIQEDHTDNHGKKWATAWWMIQ